jgi:hypothetical protein
MEKKIIVLELDEQTAHELLRSLYESGEHIAAGAPIHKPSTDECIRLGKVIDEIEAKLTTPRDSFKAS